MAASGGATVDEATYGFSAAAHILDVPESKLRYWSQVGAVGPSVRRAGKQLFTFQDLISVKAFKELTERGVKPAQIRKALDAVRASLPHVDRPLDRLRLAWSGDTLVVVDEGAAFEPTGQRLFDFSLGEMARKLAELPEDGAEPAVTRTPVRAAPRSPARGPYDLFRDGVRAEAEGRQDEAAALYRKALGGDAGLAAAHTNIGNIAYRRGDAAAARLAYEEALAVDPDQPEARFNLANIFLERGEPEMAVAELRRVLQVAPDFADAHFNLAVALDRLGGRAQARTHLERYLALDPGGQGAWADEARALLAHLGG